MFEKCSFRPLGLSDIDDGLFHFQQC